MDNTQFTYVYYEKLITKIMYFGYNIANYHNFKNIDKPCILRHDVDNDVRKALEFAIHESNMQYNLQSTYFFLISSNFYNVFSKNTLEVIDEILSLGHEIGLHFDETKYSINGNEQLLTECVEEELIVLGRALKTTIRAVSMHRPSKFTLQSDFKFQNAVNSYSKEFFNDFKYVSDSRMYWREDVHSIIESQTYDQLHILTHPFWYSDKGESTRDKILSFINCSKIERYRSFSENFRDLEEFVRPEDVR